MIKVNFKRRQFVCDVHDVIALHLFCNKIVLDSSLSLPEVKNDVLYIGSLSNVYSIERVNPTDL